MEKYKELSRYISYILRHKPDEIGLTLDSFGWGNIDLLLQGINNQGYIINRKILEELVGESEKQRFVLDCRNNLIRANQGHSIIVDLGLKNQKPPNILYHGTAKKNLKSIFEKGIDKMTRNHVHLSINKLTANQVGSRHGSSIVLKIDSEKMYQQGYAFYLSKNGIWLTERIPHCFIYREENIFY